MRDEKPGASFYRPELDALRFVAFFAVFLQHSLQRALPHLRPSMLPYVGLVQLAGGYGVDLFFVLSAYLITELLQREAELCGSIDVRWFYLRRILRIWPLYFVFLAIAAALPAVMPEEHFGAAYIAAFVLLAGNWICAIRGFPTSVAAPLWSVSLEEQFYLAWPALLRWAGIARLKTLAAAMLVVATAARIVVLAAGWPHPMAWCATFTRLDPLALGILLAAWLKGRKPRTSTATAAGLGIVAGAVILLVTLWAPMTDADAPALLIGYPLVALASAAAVFAALCVDFTRVPQPLGRTLIYLGRISYGLYVFHVLAIELAHRSGLQDWKLQGLASLALAIALAAASYQFLERPFLRLKARYAHVESRPV